MDSTGKAKALNRQYKSFLAFREKLTEEWPGILIPSISEKKIFAKEQIIYEIRKKRLQTFVDEVRKVEFLEKSKITQQFFNESLTDELFMGIKFQYTTQEHLINIQKEFNLLKSIGISKEMKEKVDKFKLKLMRYDCDIKKLFENYKKSVEQIKNYYDMIQ